MPRCHGRCHVAVEGTNQERIVQHGACLTGAPRGHGTLEAERLSVEISRVTEIAHGTHEE